MPDSIRRTLPSLGRTLPSLPVPVLQRRRRQVPALIALSAALSAWVVLYAELGTSGIEAEPLTARLGVAVRHLPDPAADPASRLRRRSDARATEASWTSRPDAPDAAAADAAASRPGP